MASGLKANFGTMTKPLHVGHSARSGLLASYLASGGFEANTSIMEHHQGFLNVFNGEKLFDPNPLIENWTAPLNIELPTLSLKQFACCGSMHQAIFAMLGLAKDEDINPSCVIAIDINLHQRRLLHTNNPLPTSALQSKFSVQYAVARVLQYRTLVLQDFTDDAFADPTVRKLLDITSVQPFSENSEGPNGLWDAKVSVTLNDGQVLVRNIINMIGRCGVNAMRRDELHEKFMNCSGLLLSADVSDQAFNSLMSLEKCENLHDIFKFFKAQ
jgi:2-methylcitrate dehydratase PrpD